jgi:hypothetical protein
MMENYTPVGVISRMNSRSYPEALWPIEDQVKAKFPDLVLSVNGPSLGGYWWIDLRLGTKPICVEWIPENGFGVSYPPHLPFTGPDEVFKDASEAAAAIIRAFEAP